MDINLLILLFIAGALLLLSFLMLSNAVGVNRKPNFYFGICLFIWSSFFWDDLLLGDLLHHQIVYTITRFIQFLAPLIFYQSVHFYSNPYSKYRIRDTGHLILAILFLILLICKLEISHEYFQIIYLMMVLGNALFYTGLSYLKIIKHRKNIESFASSKENIDLRWILWIIYATIAASVTTAFYNVFSSERSLNIYISIFFMLVVYIVAFYTIRQKEIYPKGLDVEDIDPEFSEINSGIKNKLMDDSELEELKIKLTILMEAEKLYLDNELNLVKLAEKMNISGHQLSYVINQGFGENFFFFVNKYRVKRAEELLTNSDYEKYTILAIGYEAGFNSKTSFNNAFKKLTSFTPTEYRKNRSDL
ncbi:AraC family transcriptional regulator [Elizabethkingia miricola]|uniref:AraC family transcriptional regulator n=1 Tax=Elizabethkingia miricola TaxID=172045 RepID=A0ABD4DNU2_ELIMR|nr:MULTISPECIES: AraC family transcriptional regulator [Elizabethkingia]KUY20567.1 AraC family transcriptional regulator [Elizabethkingia miricola]MCL1653246.1 AraC family transcriptional regulator [Elizabethkingia miricola]OPC70390.1 AraC family transcriptional regulator [Elizabethkingia miricola]OPC74319.1 AraC family transcriptional regulator [Elizabethkingia miricola]QCO45192.1 helix-turn-helix transcriptional regulator [Elizabethkingia sp. 2-6]